MKGVREGMEWSEYFFLYEFWVDKTMRGSRINKGSEGFGDNGRNNIYIKWIWIGKSGHVESEEEPALDGSMQPSEGTGFRGLLIIFFNLEPFSRLSSALGSVLAACPLVWVLEEFKGVRFLFLEWEHSLAMWPFSLHTRHSPLHWRHNKIFSWGNF